MASWNEYTYEDGTPYNGTEAPVGYYGELATLTLKKIPVPDKNDKTKYKYAFVVKNPKYNSVSRQKDMQLLKYYSDAKQDGDTFYMVGTEYESSKFYSDLIQQGYSVQDDFNLGKYEKKDK
jgi:hypothetical protein|tara:strand:+ start:780 stop:1142 length:363 start_codon:yes stop_codon:yes gene_type:complete